MKKIAVWIVVAAGLLLFASCGPQNTVEPLLTPERSGTPTPIVVPTCTPTVSPTPNPALKPTATPSPSPLPSPTPTLAPQKTPTPEPTVEPTLEPTATPTPSPSPTPSPEPTEALTATPTPTEEPTPTVEPTLEPTATPTPSPSPMPTATPTPTPNPEPLVTNGWQRTATIDEKNQVVFPELFRESEVSRTDRELEVSYTSKENDDIEFQINYSMRRTLQEAVDELLAAGGVIWTEYPEEKRVEYLFLEGDRLCRGILLEEQYSRALLGTSFGEEEWITGVMQVVFSYPEAQKSEYETSQYDFYVVKSGEE